MATSTSEGRLTIEIVDFDQLCSALGADVVSAFCQCFLGTAHLRTLMDAMRLNREHLPWDSVPSDRNHTSLVLLACGVMRELARVLERLRRLGIRRMLPDADPWDVLEETLTRWNNDAELRELRDKLTFHFDDQALFDQGMRTISESCARIVAFEADGREKFRWRDAMGLDVALQGLSMDKKKMERVFGHTMHDLATLSDRIHDMFFALIEARK